MSDSQFQFVFENSLDAMVIADDNGRYLQVNQPACDMFGYSREKMLGMTVGDLQTVQAPVASERYREYLRTGREIGEFSFVRADKEVRTASYSACRIRPNCHLSILRDVTAKNRAEELLRQSETRFRLLVEQSPLSIQVLSPDGRTLQVNRAWEQLWGATLDNLRDYNMLQDRQLIDKGIMPYILKAFGGEAVAIPPVLYDPEQTLPDRPKLPDSPRWTQASMYPVKDEEGHIREVILMHEDITEQRLAESAAHESEARYRRIVETAQEGIWAIDAEASTTFVNGRMAEMLGYTADEMVGRSLFSFLHGESIGLTEQALARRRKGLRGQYDACYRRKDGSNLWVIVNTTPIMDDAGKYAGAFAMMTDISARKEAEEAVARHQVEIEALNERLKRSIQETHHRVKNNLQMISALVELQVESDADMVPATAMHRIGQHTRSLAAVHDLLTQQVKTDPHSNSISTVATMDRLIPLLQATIGSRRIHTDVEDMHLPVQAGTSLTLLVSEIISNAVKHADGDIQVMLHVADGAGQLEVCDDGPGFPPDFDWRKAANTGLSLIDMAGRYELGGTISYTNRPEGGARVVVTFPL